MASFDRQMDRYCIYLDYFILAHVLLDIVEREEFWVYVSLDS